MPVPDQAIIGTARLCTMNPAELAKICRQEAMLVRSSGSPVITPVSDA